MRMLGTQTLEQQQNFHSPLIAGIVRRDLRHLQSYPNLNPQMVRRCTRRAEFVAGLLPRRGLHGSVLVCLAASAKPF